MVALAVPLLWEHPGTRHDDWTVAVSRKVLSSRPSSLFGTSSCSEGNGEG